MHMTMIPATTQSNSATPELPAPRKTFTGWVKIPVAIVLFIIRQKTVNGEKSCCLVGATSKRYN